MNLNNNDYYRDLQSLQDQCKRSLYYHSILTMTDGSTFDGIVENVDADSITVLVGEDVMEQEGMNRYDEQRQFYGYGRPRRRFRRFNRRKFPLATLAALSLLQYPYILPPYPYFYR
ncbi:MAG: hypothetical protein AB6733_06920 [Clostridiaceae bacterium]